MRIIFTCGDFVIHYYNNFRKKGVTSMKIERISENQIRCTLNKADLAEKEIMLTELAYGTDKAKELFRDLMEQAAIELGFEVDNIPLMIEAIPVNPDCLILIITKVEDPDELDTRFSRFTKHLEAARAYAESEDEEDDEDDEDDEIEEASSHTAPAGAEGLFEALSSLTEGLSALSAKRTGKVIGKTPENAPKPAQPSFRLFGFKTLDNVILTANSVRGIYHSTNTLYKNLNDNSFYLYLTRDNNTDMEFIRACNIISEYGDRLSANYAGPSYLNEHCKIIIKANALQTLAEL